LISVNVASTGVATVLLDSVTMPPAMFIACGKIFRSLSDDPAVKVVIVRAGTAKPHFSYGLDFKQVHFHTQKRRSRPKTPKMTSSQGRFPENDVFLIEKCWPWFAGWRGLDAA
jgi:enoyl-CoA hydratase/carnithine racemase